MKANVVKAADRHARRRSPAGTATATTSRPSFDLSGHVRIECGPGERTVLDGGAGDFIFVPAREIHREGNPTDDTTEVVLVRAGQGEVVVNVERPE